MNSLQDQAEALLRAGRVDEAEQVFNRLLEHEPTHLQALGFLSMAALRNGQQPRALELATRAVEAAPAEPLTQFQLGQVRSALGSLSEARAAFSAAVALQPDFYVARLHLAAVLRQQRDPAAVVHAARALQDAQRAGRWLDAGSTPASLRPLVEAAVRHVREQRGAAFQQLFEPLAREFGATELGRVRRCVSIYLQETAPVFADPRQRPSFLFFPDLPTSAYFDTRTLDWIPRLEAASLEVRRELDALLPVTAQAERVFGDDATEGANLRGTRGAPSWNGFYFYRHGVRRDDNSRTCPRTASELERLPLCRVREHGPEVLFSVFTPGTHLLPHRGVTNTRVVGHLPLIVPADCALNVGGELHVWQEGRVVVFDDTYEHEAWNRSNTVRVVMIFDLWNPHLTVVECEAVKRLVEAIGDFRHSIDAA